MARKRKKKRLMTAAQMKAACGRLAEYLRRAREARVRGVDEGEYNAWVLFIHSAIDVDGPPLFRTFEEAIGRLCRKVPPDEIRGRVGRDEAGKILPGPGRDAAWARLHANRGPDEPVLHAGVRYHALVEEAQAFLDDVPQADA